MAADDHFQFGNTYLKDQEIFQNEEQSILALISGKNPLTNRLLDSLSREMYVLKKSLELS